MKIQEILKASQTRTIADIAKNDLTIGEKTARRALQAAECYSIVGKPGWYFEGDDPAISDKSIYEFADQVKQQQKADLREAANVSTYEGLDVPRKRHSFDLDVRLVKELKVRCVQEDKTLYEAVEDALRDYLQKDRLL